MDDYKTAFVKIPDLNASTRNAMSRLYLAHYAGCDDMLFQKDLSKKTEALLIYCHAELIGFTVYELYTRECNQQPIRVIYSGDTIVDHHHWGQQALAFAWITRAGQIKQEAPDIPLYWFLIVKGHRTYRYLPTFSHSFHPHWSVQHDDLKALADRLAGDKFAKYYDPLTGVAAFPESRGHLKASYAQPTARERAKPAVNFFLQCNPDYLNGNELVCLCELCEENLKPLARRLFQGSSQ